MNNKENSLIKNTLALYVRMLFSVCVNVYISRVVLDVLGVDDFGIYSVVGGVVGLLSFINSSMSGATSRFLSIALGENNHHKLIDTYNAAKHLHLAIAIIIGVLGETIGLWIVNGYLKLPTDRMFVANLVYQLSILTTIFSILQVPYSAIIISMERMDIYAKIEIAKILLKLVAVISLTYYMHDRLLLYGILLLIVSITIYLVYLIYCHKSYKECLFSWSIKPNIIRPMLYFSGWDMLGWGGFSLNTQGRQIFMNRFFGVAMNTANGMATTASGAIMAFTNNVVMAFRPRIMKFYAASQFDQMQRMMELALFAVVLLMSFLVVPMYFGMPFLLNIWLVEVPEHTLEFCRLLLLFQFVEVVSTVIKIGIHASGKMRNFTIAGFLIQLFNLILTYALYCMEFQASITFVIAIALSIVGVIINLYYLKKDVPKLMMVNLIRELFYGSSVCGISFVICYLVDMVIKGDLLCFFAILILNTIIIAFAVLTRYYSIVRMYAISKIAKKYRK